MNISLLNKINLAVFSFSLFSISLFGQFHPERGNIPLKNFTPKEYNSTPQIWDIVQDQRGVMYFANNEGLLEYDGISWRKILVGGVGYVRSLAIDKNERIFLGGQNELGYLKPDLRGKLEYISLISFVDSAQRNFDYVYKIICQDNKVYFQTYPYLFLWDGDKMLSIPAKTKFSKNFNGNNRIVIYEKDSIFYELKSDSLIFLDESQPISKLTFTAGFITSSNDFILFTREKGFLLWKEKAISSIWNKQPLFNSFLELNYISYIKEIAQNQLAMGTWGNGILIMNQNGKVVDLIDKSDGLQDNIIKTLYSDFNGNLWLGCESGITELEILSPLSFLIGKTKSNLGAVETITRFNGKIFMAHSLGVSYINSSENALQINTIESVKDIGQCWDIVSFQQGNSEFLIAALNDSLIQINKDLSYQKIKDCLPNYILPSKKDNNRVYIIMEEGVSSIYRKKNQWIDEKNYKGIEGSFRNAVEDSSGDLWCGTIGNGLLRIKNIQFKNHRLKNPDFVYYDSSQGLPAHNPIYVQMMNQTVIAGTDSGLFSFNREKNYFIKDPAIDPAFNSSTRAIHRIKPQNDSTIWMVTFLQNGEKMEIGYLKRNQKNTWSWICTPFKTISEGIIHSIYHDPDGVTWMGGTEGIYRFDNKVDKNYKKDFTTLIRLCNTDSTLFFGTYFDKNGYVSNIQPEDLKPVLPYSSNSLTFRYAAVNTEEDPPLTFSYYLENYDRKWSEWSTETKKEYTNLFEGHYTFRVKARNVYNQEAREATYEFTILPPWYRTWLAYIGYFFGLTGFIYLVVTLYTRNLRAIIKERTAEIRHQKEIVEEKNEHILDSIKYAKRIQDALITPKDAITNILPDHFILFKPRDIVSGDFYWMGRKNNAIITVAADCTGHGVPGAFVSMLGIAFLNEIINKTEELQANMILNQLRELVLSSLRQTGKDGESKDGMDIALCIIDKDKMKLQFAGANNPLFIVRGQELISLKADRMPVGYYLVMKPFQNNEFDLMPGDMLYTFSDGYEDQFGGTDNSKFKVKRFKELLITLVHKPLEEQKQILDDTIEEWKGIYDQIDDILVVGIKV